METAVFNCTYTGTVAVPSWVVNNTVFHFIHPPTNHRVTRISGGYSLSVYAAIELNTSIYKCAFLNIFPTVESNTGFLYILLQGKKYDTCIANSFDL